MNRSCHFFLQLSAKLHQAFDNHWTLLNLLHIQVYNCTDSYSWKCCTGWDFTKQAKCILVWICLNSFWQYLAFKPRLFSSYFSKDMIFELVTFKETRVYSWCYWPRSKVTFLSVMTKVSLSQAILLAHRVLCFLTFRLFPSVFEVTLSVPEEQGKEPNEMLKVEKCWQEDFFQYFINKI